MKKYTGYIVSYTENGAMHFDFVRSEGWAIAHKMNKERSGCEDAQISNEVTITRKEKQ